MPLIKEPDTEPIPGYRLMEPLGQGGFGEVWKCEAPGGLFKAIKFVQGSMNTLEAQRCQAQQEWNALQRIKAIRHPFLLGMDRVEVVENELIIVMELADRSLLDVFRECQRAGLPGIPREELLSYLREAAEVLDVINLHHNLQHLDIKPANLFLVNHHVKVGDFGLVKGLAEGADEPGAGTLPGITPLYCAPEMLQGKVSKRSDQYSLAVVYQELLTGKLPFEARNPRELLLKRATREPDLSPLPEAERRIVARALTRDPERRFNSCTEFVRALAPELMPVRSSPFLTGLLQDGHGPAPRREQRTETVPVCIPATVAAAPGRGRSRTVSVRPAAPERHAPGDGKAAGSYAGFSGYRFLKCLARGQLCETWKVEAPDGRPRLLKFPSGLNDGSDPAEAEAVRFLSSLHHPNLLPVEVVRSQTGRLAFVMELLEGTLADRLTHCQTVGLPGIPRRELLDHMRAAAEALDALYLQDRLQHLCLNPRTLVLQGQRLLIMDIGLAQLMWLPAGRPVGQLNGRYASPELCQGEVSPSADQFSLAVIFQEMLTGTSPFRGRSTRSKSRPNLDMLPAPDREAIARALHIDPDKRFPTCKELIDALDSGTSATPSSRIPATVLPPVIASPTPGSPRPDGTLPQAAQVVTQTFHLAVGEWRMQQSDSINYVLQPGNLLRHTCVARLSPSLVRLKLEGYCQHWNGVIVVDDAGKFVLEVPLTGSFWQRCLGRKPALEIRLCFAPTRHPNEPLTELRVEMEPVRCSADKRESVLAEEAPHLLHSLRAFLHMDPDRRTRARVPFLHPVGVFPVLRDQGLEDPLVCQGKDISLQGIGLYFPEAPPSPRFYVQTMLTPELARVAVLARAVRTQRCSDGRYEVGAVFVEQPERWAAPAAAARA
jgi:serine/threonine protein kinase